MRRCIAIILATFVLVSVLATGLGGATTTTTVQYQETTTGISMGPIAESEIENLETYESTLESFGINPPSEVTVLASANGDRHIVFSSEPIPAGEATVEGRSFSTGETSGEIIIADNFEVETEGDRISFDELRNNPQQYDHELVRFDAGAAMGSIAAKPTSGVSSQQTAAYLTEPGNLSSDLFQQSPGELASTISLTDSNSSVERSSSSVPQFPEYGITGQSFSQQFWGEGEATVDAAVVPVYRQFGDGDSIQTGRQLIIVDVNYDSQILDSPAEIRSGSYEGETVTVSSDIVGSSTSTQEYLTEVASCGDKTVSVPMSPPVCVPVTHDIVVHSGVLVDGTSPGEVPIAYAGISNKIQNSPTEVKTGRYRITGEVVSTSEIDSSLEGSYALRVFDMGRVGDANIASGFQTDANQLEQRIKAQLDLSESEWGTQSGTENQQSGGEGGDGNNDSGGESEPPTEGPYVKSTELRTSSIEAGESADVWVDVWNPGDEPAEKEVTISAGGEVVKTKTVSVGTVRSQTVIKAAVSDPGTYEITVNGKSAGEIVVFDSSSEDGEGANESGSVSVDSFFNSQDTFATGVFLAFISVAVFLLGVMLEVARSFKNRSNGESPNITEQMTEGVIATAMAGFLVSGLLVNDGLSLFLLLFGAVGIVSFAGRYVFKPALYPYLNAALQGDGEWSKSVVIITPIALALGGMGFLSAASDSVLSGPLAATVVKYTFGLLSFLVVIFGLVVGMFRFYKKHFAESGLNTSGDLGLVITVIGSISMITAGLLSGDLFGGGGFIFLGVIVLLGCLFVTAGKTIYQIV